MRTMQRFGTLALAALLAACNGESTGPDLTPAADLLLARDVATQMGEAVGEDVEMMGGPTGQFGFGFAAAEGLDDAPFRCGTNTRDQRTVVRTCTFRDAGGNEQAAYDPATTESVAIHVEVSGSVTRDNWSASIERERDLVVSGLAGAETSRTWNGTGSASATRSRHNNSGEERTYDMTSNGSITDVVVNLPRTENRWPESGTISRHVSVTVTGGPRDGTTYERDVTITFNGTQFVPIQVNDKTFTFDLRARRIVRDGD
ncbi:MAG: hypothetical protein AB7L66_00455 [Gemmatimonadales bacterium]